MHDEGVHRSRWTLRAMEWDDARARYPNLWREGMPCQLLAFERLVSRLGLGDLIAIYYPSSQRHPERSRRFLGISRVTGLRRSHDPGFAWIDLETAHRFDPPLDLKQQPRRVFLCCDKGWPAPEVNLFNEVFDAAIKAGWKPTDEECEQRPETSPPQTPEPEPRTEGIAYRMFAGVDYSGDMRDPRKATWLAIVALQDERFRLTRLEATGRSGLQRYLRDPDSALMSVEAIGLDFPFGLPLAFAESLLGGAFPKEGWWGLVKKFEKLSRPSYLVALQEFRDAQGELKRLTDEKAEASSPLHRVGRDLGPTAYHGIRMIGEDRSRYAVRPFENAQGKLLLEVRPTAALRRLVAADEKTPLDKVLSGLSSLDSHPVELSPRFHRLCLASREALHAVVAARCAAIAVLTGEADRSADELAAGEGERLRREGWIYGLQEPERPIAEPAAAEAQD